MKFLLPILAVIMVLAFVAALLWLRRTSPPTTSKISPQQAAAQIAFQQDMRKRLLTEPMTAFAIDPAMTHSGTWGILMETGYEAGTATLVSLCDGTASLYLGRGGGIIGGHGHEPVRLAVDEFLALASRHVQDMHATQTYPMPDAGRVRFYVMTDTSVFTTEADESQLGEGDHKLSPLFYAGHEVITQLRRIAEERPPARDEMDKLLNSALHAAVHFLEKSGEFYPFGLALQPDGEIAHVATWDGNDHPKSDDVLTLLHQALRQGVDAGDYKAIAIVTDITIRKTVNDPPADAVRVQIEHPDAPPVACILPYRMESGKCIQGDLTAEPAEPKVIGIQE